MGTPIVPASGHVWGVDGVKNTIRLPFAYGSEPKRKVLDLLAPKESLIPTGSQSELDALGWAVEVVDYGKGLKRDCVSFGKDGLVMKATINKLVERPAAVRSAKA